MCIPGFSDSRDPHCSHMLCRRDGTCTSRSSRPDIVIPEHKARINTKISADYIKDTAEHLRPMNFQNRSHQENRPLTSFLRRRGLPFQGVSGTPRFGL
eukprot:1623964-Amphidinium_carterae.1